MPIAAKVFLYYLIIRLQVQYENIAGLQPYYHVKLPKHPPKKISKASSPRPLHQPTAKLDPRVEV